MPLISLTQSSFAAGELDRRLYGRIDLAKYQSGLQAARNVFVQAYGGVSKRPGTQYIMGLPMEGKIPYRFIDFRFSPEQGYLLVFGHRRVFFFRNGLPILGANNLIVSAFHVDRGTGLVLNSKIGVEISGLTPGGKIKLLPGQKVDLKKVPNDLIFITQKAHGFTNGDLIVKWNYGGISSFADASPPTSKLITPSIADRVTPRTFRMTDYSVETWSQPFIPQEAFAGQIAEEREYIFLDDLDEDLPSETPREEVAIQADEAREDFLVGGIDKDPENKPRASDQDRDAGFVSRIYTLPTPYTIDEVWQLTYAQSFDVMILAHPNHAPQKLSRFGHNHWTLDPVIIAPRIKAPLSVNATPVNPPKGGGDASTSIEYYYQVTAIGDGGEESLPSGVASCMNDLAFRSAEGGNRYNTISWDKVPKAVRYRVYRGKAGASGFIGSTSNLTMDDANILPEIAISPPGTRDPFSDENYPAAVDFCEQRLVLAGSKAHPQTGWMSGTANIFNFNVSEPVKADQAITFTLASNGLHVIRHLVTMNHLIGLTAAGTWKISSGDRPLTPATLTARLQNDIGSSLVKPLKIDNRVLFVSRWNTIHSLGAGVSGGELVGDRLLNEELSLLANHLFEGHRIVDWAYAPSPHKLI